MIIKLMMRKRQMTKCKPDIKWLMNENCAWNRNLPEFAKWKKCGSITHMNVVRWTLDNIGNKWNGELIKIHAFGFVNAGVMYLKIRTIIAQKHDDCHDLFLTRIICKHFVGQIWLSVYCLFEFTWEKMRPHSTQFL